MAGICLTCLSTRNLNKIREKEWITFDVLLHPISKKYKTCLRSNPKAKICASCRNSLHDVQVFRRNSLKNFLLLMNKWNKNKSSTNNSWSTLPNDDEDDDDPLNDKPDTKVGNKCEFTQLISPKNSSSEDDLHDIIKDDSQSEDFEEKDAEVLYITDTIEHSDSQPNCCVIEDQNIAEEVDESRSDKGVFSPEISCASKPKREPKLPISEKSPGKPKAQKKALKRRKKMATLSKEQRNQEFQCEICNKSCKSSRDLMNHGNKFHGRSSPVNCDLCNKKCNNSYSLYRHNRYVHLKIKPKSELEEQYCDVCDKQYKHAQTYKKHFKQLSHITAEILKKERLKNK
ncbi:hypothetical protein O0L34_g10684 [Tuta absoluta]|nr:hypothetical protein O0L34_g10684 [Tuta absoluta]